MAHEPALDGLPRLLPSPSPLSLKAREHSSLSLKRIFDQINSACNDRPCLGAINALERIADGSQRFPAQDSVHRPSHRQLSANGASADVDLRLATGTRQETRNFFCNKESLQSRVGEASEFETSRLGFEQETGLASLQNMRCLEPSTKIPGIDRIDSNLPEREPVIDRSKKRPIFNLQESSMQESNQRTVRSSSPALSFQTQQSDASDHNPASGFFRHIQENMQATTSSAPSYFASCRQPKAQLTIFYAGMVHVYDDVPADKAHAIMVLARNGNPSNAHYVNAPSMGVPSSGALASISTTRELGVHLIPTAFSNATVSSSSFPAKMKQRLVQRSDAELPFARKASLARFLERRKDRVQAKAFANTCENGVEREDVVSDQPSSHKRLCSRPASSSPPHRHELGNQTRSPSTPPMT